MRTQVDLLFLRVEDSRLRWAADAACLYLCRGFSNPPEVLTHWAFTFSRDGRIQLVDGIRDNDGDLSFVSKWRNKKELQPAAATRA